MPDGAPWENYGAAAHGPWEQYGAPPPSAPPEPAQPSLLSRVANAPANLVGKVGEWASGKAQRDQEANLSAAARGQERPNSAVKDYGVGVLGDTAKLASGLLRPSNAAQIGAAAVAPEVMLPYFAYKGTEAALTPKQEGESTPDEIQRRLLGASQAVGSVAGAAAGPKTLTERVGATVPTREGIGRTFRGEEGRGPIKPVVSKLSRVAGGYVGSHLGPLGAAAGVYAGPSVADAIIPRAPAEVPPPEGQLPARPNIGPTEGPAAAQAFTPLNHTPPNAAGQVERVGVQHNPEQAVIAPRQPGRTIGDRTLPPGPTPKPESTPARVGKLVNQAFGVEPMKANEPIYARAGSPARSAELEQPQAGPRIATPSRNETMTENLKNRVPGSNPLEPGKTLKEQPPSEQRTPAQVKEETVHPMDRQFIHVNGSQAFERTAGLPDTRADLLNLQNDQLREVLRKSGEDMGTKRVGSGGKTADPNDYTRREAFDILFEKGYTPEQIVKEAPPRSKPAPNRVPFGPPREQIGKTAKP